jgi:hypothetical protein
MSSAIVNDFLADQPPVEAMSSLNISGVKSTQKWDGHTASRSAASLSLSSQCIHADDFLNDTQDVAPAVHVSTTFRYNRNPESLVPIARRDVRSPMCHEVLYL